MSPLLVAILGAVAHADGNTPVLEPLPKADTETTTAAPRYEFPDEPLVVGTVVSNPCIADHPRGSTGPLPVANQASVATEEAACLKGGGTAEMCDASQMISMAAALCVSKLEPVREVRIRSWNQGVSTPRLVWVIQDHVGGCGGSSQYIDGWTGNILSTGACVYGRPCTTSRGPARAPLIRRQGWA